MQITLNTGKILLVEKLPLGKYADLLKAFEELPKHLGEFKDFSNFSNEQFFQVLPKLLGSCLPDFIRVIEIATTLTSEEVQALGFDEAMEILIAIYTVNNYQAVFEKLKKVRPQPVQTAIIPEENLTPTN